MVPVLNGDDEYDDEEDDVGDDILGEGLAPQLLHPRLLQVLQMGFGVRYIYLQIY